MNRGFNSNGRIPKLLENDEHILGYVSLLYHLLVCKMNRDKLNGMER